MTFNQVVEEISKLSKEEKEEIKGLLESYLIDESREEFKRNFEESKKLDKEGKLQKVNRIEDFDEELNREI